jgi:hypothetical protein
MSVSAVGSGAASAQLVRLTNGEYTAASVQANLTDATKLGLVKQADGNYGTTPPPAPSDARSSPSVLSALTAIRLGGA